MGNHDSHKEIMEILERLESRVEQVASLVEVVLDEVVPAEIMRDAQSEE